MTKWQAKPITDNCVINAGTTGDVKKWTFHQALINNLSNSDGVSSRSCQLIHEYMTVWCKHVYMGAQYYNQEIFSQC